MPSFTSSDGLRIGIPNPETDDEFKERLRNYIFEYVCRKNKKGEIGTYTEMMERFNAAHQIRRIAETYDVEYDQELITGDGTEFRLTQKGFEKCNKLNDD